MKGSHDVLEFGCVRFQVKVKDMSTDTVGTVTYRRKLLSITEKKCLYHET